MFGRFLLGLIVLGAISCRRETASDLRNANVLLVTLDTTRADHIGAYGYKNAQTPTFERLAKEGVLFEHCITPSAHTPSASSIWQGSPPPAH